MSREQRIAARLVAALEPLFPAWCTIAIASDSLTVFVDGTFDVSISIGWDDRDPADLAFNVLSTIQDAIVRTSTNPWPPASEPTRLPLPDAAVRQGMLVAWFGPEAHSDLAIPPIDLTTA